MLDLVLRCSGSLGWALSPLFQQGVFVPVTPGTRMTDFLLGAPGIPPDYLTERVQTIFLDGRPVDDPGTSLVGPGSVVALSASLPGLAGATLRKGGTYASFRSSISHAAAAGEEHRGEPGLATLKLFNLLIGELGPPLLRRGVLVPASRILDLLRAGELEGRFAEAEVDDVAVKLDQLRGRLAELEEEPVRLRMTNP